MNVERGYKTSEFWLSAISSLVAVLVPLLVAYGVFDQERGQMWAALILLVASIVVPIVLGSIAKNYNDGRTVLKLTAMEVESARLAGAGYAVGTATGFRPDRQ